VAEAATNSRRILTVICLAAAGWAFSVGLGAPLASLVLKAADHDDTVIGLNHATYYLSVVVASLFVPRLMARWGRACPVAGMVLAGLSMALFPWAESLPGWFLLRSLNGCAGALTLIPLETLINHHAPPGRRARLFGVFELCIAAGAGLGLVVGLLLYPLAPRLTFAVGGGLAWAAAALGARRLPRETVEEHEAFDPAPLSVRQNLLSLGTAWSQGFLEAVLIAFLSVYLLGLGYREASIGWLMGSLLLGVVLFQMPVAWLADRLGRTRVVLVCHAAVLASLLCLPYCSGAAELAAWLFVLGACCGAEYPVALAVLGERLPPTALARANAWFLASNCAGSVVGPALTGRAMDLFGSKALFGTSAGSVGLVLVVWVVCGLGTRSWRSWWRGRGSNADDDPGRMAA
jgi:MFS family permease